MAECLPACCQFEGVHEEDCDPLWPTDDDPHIDCRRIDSDRENCGECGRACEEDQVCRGGQCRDCEFPEVRCENACVDLRDNIQHWASATAFARATLDIATAVNVSPNILGKSVRSQMVTLMPTPTSMPTVTLTVMLMLTVTLRLTPKPTRANPTRFSPSRELR